MRAYFAGAFYTLSLYLVNMQYVVPALVSIILGTVIMVHRKKLKNKPAHTKP